MGSEVQREVVLELWTLFDSPKDRPGMFVARRFEVLQGCSEPVATLDEVLDADREILTKRLAPKLEGKVFLLRDPRDHESVVGTWL